MVAGGSVITIHRLRLGRKHTFPLRHWARARTGTPLCCDIPHGSPHHPGSKSEIRFGTEFLPPFEMPEPSWKPWASVKCHLLAVSDVLSAAPGCRPRLSTEAEGILAGAGMSTSWKMQGRAHHPSLWWTQKNKAEQMSAIGQTPRMWDHQAKCTPQASVEWWATWGGGSGSKAEEVLVVFHADSRSYWQNIEPRVTGK